MRLTAFRKLSVSIFQLSVIPYFLVELSVKGDADRFGPDEHCSIVKCRYRLLSDLSWSY